VDCASISGTHVDRSKQAASSGGRGRRITKTQRPNEWTLKTALVPRALPYTIMNSLCMYFTQEAPLTSETL